MSYGFVLATQTHNFTGGSDGELPIWYGNLVFDNKGNPYGTASGGGNSACGGGCGIVFELSPSKNGWQKTRSLEIPKLIASCSFRQEE